MLSSVFHLKKTKTKKKSKTSLNVQANLRHVTYVTDVWRYVHHRRVTFTSSSEGKEPQTKRKCHDVKHANECRACGIWVFIYSYLFMYVFGRRKCHTMAWIWKLEDSLWESVFSSYHMGSGMLLGPWSLVVNSLTRLSYLVVFFTCEWWCSSALTGIFSVARQFSREDLRSLTLWADLWHVELVSNKIENS